MDSICHCFKFLQEHADRVQHYQRRIAQQRLNGRAAIFVVRAEDSLGSMMLKRMVPGYEPRSAEELPVAIGWTIKEKAVEVLGAFDGTACRRLSEFAKTAVVVVDQGKIAVFSAEEVAPVSPVAN